MRKVLVVEDEPKIANMERDFLEGAGFEPYVTDNGEEALKIMDEVKIDAIILDVMLPGEDGFSLCRKMREKTDAPIIFATARTEDADIVRGLGLGADDYIVKPFSSRELLARIKAHLRRERRRTESSAEPIATAETPAVSLDPLQREARKDGCLLDLTPREFELLQVLLAHKGQVLTRDQLLEKVWGYDFEGESKVVNVTISDGGEGAARIQFVTAP